VSREPVWYKAQEMPNDAENKEFVISDMCEKCSIYGIGRNYPFLQIRVNCAVVAGCDDSRNRDYEAS
jgi:hypothetical protein